MGALIIDNYVSIILQVVQNGEYVGYTLAKKVGSTVLEMSARDNTVTPAVISVAQQLLSVYNCTEVMF